MVEFIDDNGRVFGLVNVIDLLVVLVVLAVLAARIALVVGSNEPESEPEPETTTATVEVRISGIQSYVASSIPQAGPLEAGNVSRITNRTVRPQEVVVQNESGDLLVRAHPRLQTALLEVSLPVTETEGDLQFDGSPLEIGRTVSLDFGHLELDGTVTGIETTD
ncbi:MAG: hypothetical protein ACI8XM_000162 [Haloarculaceae archaeon]|jgi:hypothetical protein